jgi:hypothetical protein
MDRPIFGAASRLRAEGHGMVLVRTALLGTALALSVSGQALAQNAQERAAMQQYCTQDYLRLCSQFSPDTPQLEQCFVAKTAELSPDCRSTIAAFQQRQASERRR